MSAGYPQVTTGVGLGEQDPQGWPNSLRTGLQVGWHQQCAGHLWRRLLLPPPFMSTAERPPRRCTPASSTICAPPGGRMRRAVVTTLPGGGPSRSRSCRCCPAAAAAARCSRLSGCAPAPPAPAEGASGSGSARLPSSCGWEWRTAPGRAATCAQLRSSRRPTTAGFRNSWMSPPPLEMVTSPALSCSWTWRQEGAQVQGAAGQHVGEAYAGAPAPLPLQALTCCLWNQSGSHPHLARLTWRHWRDHAHHAASRAGHLHVGSCTAQPLCQPFCQPTFLPTLLSTLLSTLLPTNLHVPAIRVYRQVAIQAVHRDTAAAGAQGCHTAAAVHICHVDRAAACTARADVERVAHSPPGPRPQLGVLRDMGGGQAACAPPSTVG